MIEWMQTKPDVQAQPSGHGIKTVFYNNRWFVGIGTAVVAGVILMLIPTHPSSEIRNEGTVSDSIQTVGQTGNNIINTDSVLIETPKGQVNGINLTFAVSHKPLYVSEDGINRFEMQDYLYSNGEITFLDKAEAPSDVIKSFYGANPQQYLRTREDFAASSLKNDFTASSSDEILHIPLKQYPIPGSLEIWWGAMSLSPSDYEIAGRDLQVDLLRDQAEAIKSVASGSSDESGMSFVVTYFPDSSRN